MIYPEDLTHIAWKCVRFESAFDLSAMTPALQDYDMRLFHLSALDIETKEQLFDSIAIAMEFPDYFGRNWDALIDCLRDMSWVSASGYVLAVYGAEQFWRRQERLAGAFVEVWLFVAEFWGKHEKPFHLVFIW
jgi:RNAse (barnase) inhibitor barstar